MAWAVLLVTMATVSLYVGLLINRRVNPPVVPVTGSNDLAPYQQGDALLVERIGAADVASRMVVAVRWEGDVVLGRVESLRQDGERLRYRLVGVERGGTVEVTDRDLVGHADRRIPLVGWPLLAARERVVQLLGALFVVATIVLLIFVGRNPLDLLDDEDDDPRFELPPPPPLALPAGPARHILFPVPARPAAADPVEPVRPDPPMPYVERPMSITPDDLRQVRFAQTRKGYDTEAVDRALDAVAESLEAMFDERQHLVERLRASEAELERLRASEAQIGQALAVAERGAEQIKADAQAEAQRILAQAQAIAQGALPAGGPTDPATVELLGEMRAIRALLQGVFGPGGPSSQQQPRQ